MALKKSTEGKIIETLRIETPERFSGSVSFYFERILMFPSKTLFTRVQENFWMDEFLTRATCLYETVQILLKKAEPSVYTSPTYHRQVN